MTVEQVFDSLARHLDTCDQCRLCGTGPFCNEGSRLIDECTFELSNPYRESGNAEKGENNGATQIMEGAHSVRPA